MTDWPGAPPGPSLPPCPPRAAQFPSRSLEAGGCTGARTTDRGGCIRTPAFERSSSAGGVPAPLSAGTRTRAASPTTLTRGRTLPVLAGPEALLPEATAAAKLAKAANVLDVRGRPSRSHPSAPSKRRCRNCRAVCSASAFRSRRSVSPMRAAARSSLDEASMPANARIASAGLTVRVRAAAMPPAVRGSPRAGSRPGSRWPGLLSFPPTRCRRRSLRSPR